MAVTTQKGAAKCLVEFIVGGEDTGPTPALELLKRYDRILNYPFKNSEEAKRSMLKN